MSGDATEPRDDSLEDVLSYVRSETTLGHLVQYAVRRGYIPTQSPSDPAEIARLRADAAAESLEKISAWAWAQDGGFLAGTALEIVEYADKTAAFLRRFGVDAEDGAR